MAYGVWADGVWDETTFASGFWEPGVEGPAPESAPNNLAVTDNGDGSATLSWTDTVTDNTGYAVERKAGNGAYVEIEDDAGDDGNYEDAGPLTESIIYTYRVKILGGDLANSYSNEASVGGDFSSTPMVVDEAVEKLRHFWGGV